MSNLLKYGTIVNKSERVIDYNDLIKERVDTAREMLMKTADSDGFVSGLDADIIEQVEGSNEENLVQEVSNEVNLEEIQNKADEIIEEAQLRADEIIENAKIQAEEMSGEIKENARQEGYNKGLIQCETEFEQKHKQLEEQFNDMSNKLLSEIEEQKKMMEPQIVDALLEVFEKVTKTVSEDNKDIIIHLINNVLSNTENSREYIIKVSPQDYEFVTNNQGKIYCAMSSEVSLEIIHDSSLNHNECLIETENGVFNCSLDVELNNLIKDIKLLSCL